MTQKQQHPEMQQLDYCPYCEGEGDGDVGPCRGPHCGHPDDMCDGAWAQNQHKEDDGFDAYTEVPICKAGCCHEQHILAEGQITPIILDKTLWDKVTDSWYFFRGKAGDTYE